MVDVTSSMADEEVIWFFALICPNSSAFFLINYLLESNILLAKCQQDVGIKTEPLK